MSDEAPGLRIALAQVNVTVGDIDGNARLIAEWIAGAKDAGAQLVVFPEQTVTGDTASLAEVAGVRVGLTICEDIWYPGPPASVEALAGASLIVNPSASPYHRGKGADRERMFQARARETGAAFAICNLVGGQDEL